MLGLVVATEIVVLISLLARTQGVKTKVGWVLMLGCLELPGLDSDEAGTEFGESGTSRAG